MHGALCIAYSGRCLLSGYFNHRDPNQGSCTNSCRWDYKVKPAKEDAGGDVWRDRGTRRNAPGELMPIEEDEHGTYIINSKDLRAIEHVQRLVEIGVDSLKIEGRTKSPYYVARTCQAYRQAIDDAVAGRALRSGTARRNSTAWPTAATPTASTSATTTREYQNYLRGHSESGRSLYVGDVVAYDAARGWPKSRSRTISPSATASKSIHPDGNLESSSSACKKSAMASRRRRCGAGQRPSRAHPPAAGQAGRLPRALRLTAGADPDAGDRLIRSADSGWPAAAACSASKTRAAG